MKNILFALAAMITVISCGNNPLKQEYLEIKNSGIQGDALLVHIFIQTV